MAKIDARFAYCDSLWSAYLLEPSHDGESVRLQRSIQKTGGESLSRARRQAIKYDRRGETYVTFRGRRLPLNLFMRTT